MFNQLLYAWRVLCMTIPFLRPLLGAPRRVVFIRHAQSVNNKVFGEGKITFVSPEQISAEDHKPDHRISLSEEGKVQSRNSGVPIRMKFGVPDAVIHSGYLRTCQTMHGVMSAYQDMKIPAYEDDRFRERDAGYMYRMLQKNADEYFPYQQSYWDFVGLYYARPPGGESLADMREKRLVPALVDLFNRFSGKSVFVFTHGRVIQCVRSHLDGLSLEQMEVYLQNKHENPKNCSITVYEYSPKQGKLILVEYNTVCWQAPQAPDQ